MEFIKGAKHSHYSASFANKMISELSKAHAQTTSKPRQAALRAIARKLLTKTHVTYAVTVLAFLGGTTLLQARTNDSTVANRLYQNSQLFLNASAEELEQIAQDPQATQACRDIAQALHQWASIQNKTDLQYTTQQELRRTLQIRVVPAR